MYLDQGARKQQKVQQLELIKLSHFVGHCLMIAKDENEEIFHQLWHPSMWSDAHHQD